MLVLQARPDDFIQVHCKGMSGENVVVRVAYTIKSGGISLVFDAPKDIRILRNKFGAVIPKERSTMKIYCVDYPFPISENLVSYRYYETRQAAAADASNLYKDFEKSEDEQIKIGNTSVSIRSRFPASVQELEISADRKAITKIVNMLAVEGHVYFGDMIGTKENGSDVIGTVREIGSYSYSGGKIKFIPNESFKDDDKTESKDAGSEEEKKADEK